jgi:hypothetical protein
MRGCLVNIKPLLRFQAEFVKKNKKWSQATFL